MGKTAPITEQLATELLYTLEKGEFIGEMEAARKMRQAKGIPSPNGRIIVEGLVLAAKGNTKAAEEHFNKFLDLYHSAEIGIAFGAYLFRTRKLKQYLTLSLRLVDEFPYNFDVIQKGRSMLYFSGDAKGCRVSSESGAKLINKSESAEEFRMVGELWAKNIEAAQDASGATQSELRLLSETVMSVIEVHKSYPVDYQYYPMFNEQSAALVAITDIAEPEKIAEMNFDLAIALSEKDELQASNLTAWFECKKDNMDGVADGC